MEYQKHTIVIYSPVFEGGIELDALVREATEGCSICTDYEIENVLSESLPEDAASFFTDSELIDNL